MQILTASILASLAITLSMPTELTQTAPGKEVVSIEIREPATVSLQDLIRQADVVALVNINSGDAEHYGDVVYKATVTQAIKGVTDSQVVYFGPFLGYRVGSQYIVALRRTTQRVGDLATNFEPVVAGAAIEPVVAAEFADEIVRARAGEKIRGPRSVALNARRASAARIVAGKVERGERARRDVAEDDQVARGMCGAAAVAVEPKDGVGTALDQLQMSRSEGVGGKAPVLRLPGQVAEQAHRIAGIAGGEIGDRDDAFRREKHVAGQDQMVGPAAEDDVIVAAIEDDLDQVESAPASIATWSLPSAVMMSFPVPPFRIARSAVPAA